MNHDETGLPSAMLESIETLIFEAIGITAAVLSELERSDLTLAQWRLLVIVGREPDVRVGRVATLLSASQASTSRLISRLERRGYLSTRRDETDRRATLVQLTAVGRELREVTVQLRRRRLADALRSGQPLPDDLAGGLLEIARRLRGYA